MLISPADLMYFIEIASTKNLSRAAERIGVTQPSLTLSIKRIEHSLGTEVLIRSKKGVSLTKAGSQLLKHSKVMMQHWDQIKSEVLSSVNEVTGGLSLGCHPSVGLYTLDKFLPKVLEAAPNLEISLFHDLSRNIVERIISLELDLGLVINPVRHPDLIIQNLLEDTVTLWTTGKNKSNVDYKSKNAVLICDPELLQTQDILKKLKKSGLHFSRVVTSNNLENIANLTASGAGIGILPTRIAKKMAGNKIHEIKEAPKFKDTLSVVYRVENKKVKSLQYLVSEILNKIN
jgi:LysR family transcriptional regulator, cell division regulator